MIHVIRAVMTMMLLAFATAKSDAQTVIGIVDDGPQARPALSLPMLESEIAKLAGDEFRIALPDEKHVDGGWTLRGVRDAITMLARDPEVDIIITTGLIGSNEAAQIADLPKPVIAAIVADVQLQEFPFARSANRIVSGKSNFAYVARVQTSDKGDFSFARSTVDEEIDIFHDAVGFRNLAVVLDRLTIESIPSLANEKARDVDARLGIKTTIVAFGESVAATVAALPADTDAVLIGPLQQLDNTQLRELAAAMVDRRLPTFTLFGRTELASGFLMSSGGRAEDAVRFSRRMALNVQRILLGDDPSEIDVRIAEPQRLAINMRTAAAIGFYPRYAVLADAEQLFGDGLDTAESLGLSQAMAIALDANLSLQLAAVEPLIAAQTRRLARSQLYPQLGIGARATRIDEDRANPVFQAERSVDAQLTASQIIYSDDAHAAYKIAAYLEKAANYGYEVEVLDTLQTAANSYLTVLRARALEAVRRANLEVTRTNLELSRLRQTIGTSGRGDVLRWESQIATDRQNLVLAEADSRVALTSFNQVLSRSQNSTFAPLENDVPQSIAIFEDERFRAFVDNAAVWELFQDFSVQKALEVSPELLRIDAFAAAQDRQVTAAKRKYYVPELSLDANLGTNLSRGGAGSEFTAIGIDDDSWSVSLSATWPLFTSGGLKAKLNEDRYTLQRIERNRALLEQQLEARTRVALHRASGTYPSLEFSSEAAAAAVENLELITDSYRIGVVSVTDLVDAQNAALAASLNAVDARYAYLIDVVDVLRATSDFSLLIDPGSTEVWFQEVESYISQRGAVTGR